MIQTAITGLGATAHTIVCLRGFSVSLGGLDTWHLPPKDSCPGQGSAMDRLMLEAVIDLSKVARRLSFDPKRSLARIVSTYGDR